MNSPQKTHTETALRLIGAVLIVLSIAATVASVQGLSRVRGGAPVDSVIFAIAWGSSPALFGFLMLKLAKALEWIGDIRAHLGIGASSEPPAPPPS